MRMIAVVSASILVLSAQSAIVGAQVLVGTPEVEFGSRKVELPKGETTEVKGEIPVDLSGFWLVSETHELPGPRGSDEKQLYSVLQLYRISKAADGALQVHFLDFAPPPAVAEKLGKARAANQSWAPQTEDVAAVTAALRADMPQIDPGRRGRHVVASAENLPSYFKGTPESKGASFVVESLFQPEKRPLYAQSYFFVKTGKAEMSGKLSMGSVPQNVHGVPLPLSTRGEFRWIRLDLPLAPPTPAAKP